MVCRYGTTHGGNAEKLKLSEEGVKVMKCHEDWLIESERFHREGKDLLRDVQIAVHDKNSVIPSIISVNI